MNSLALYFSGPTRPQLQETVFSHLLLKEVRHATRGKGLGQASLSFQWTAALQALCLLMLRYKRLGGGARLEGARGTPAASLDYSLSKRTQWLKDMFGVDRHEDLIALRFLRRVNTERRRGPRVWLQINPEALRPEQVLVFLNDAPLRDCRALLELEHAIEQAWKPKAPHPLLRGRDSQDHADPRGAGREIDLPRLIEAEVLAMLRHTNIFHRSSLAAILDNLAKNPSILKVTKRPLRFGSDLDLEMSGAQRLGLDATQDLPCLLESSPPLEIAVAGSQVGALALFTYLRAFKGFRFKINYRFPYAIDIKRRIVTHSFSRPPDLAVLGSAPAASLMTSGAKGEYAPLMLMPSISHAVVRPQSGAISGRSAFKGEMLLLREEPSTSLFYLEDLCRQGVGGAEALRTENREPDEVAVDLRAGNPEQQAVLFFPYYSFNQVFNNCCLAARAAQPLHVKESILFVHQSLAEKRELLRCIDVALRDAWLELMSNRSMRSRVVAEMLRDREYLEFLYRTSGLAFMRQAPELESLAA